MSGSVNHGDNQDKDIDNENMQAGDFMILVSKTSYN